MKVLIQMIMIVVNVKNLGELANTFVSINVYIDFITVYSVVSAMCIQILKDILLTIYFKDTHMNNFLMYCYTRELQYIDRL